MTIANHDEASVLAVAGAPGNPTGVEDPLLDFFGDRLVGVLATIPLARCPRGERYRDCGDGSTQRSAGQPLFARAGSRNPSCAGDGSRGASACLTGALNPIERGLQRRVSMWRLKLDPWGQLNP